MSVTRTADPSRIIFCDLEKDQFFHVHNRTGAIVGQFGADLARILCNEVSAMDKAIQNVNPRFGPRHYLKLREVAIDDKNGSFTLYVQYLHDREVEPELTVDQIMSALHNGEARHHGQGQWVKAYIVPGSFASDSFSPTNRGFYPAVVVG